MIYIGNHISSSDGFLAMGNHALSLGADTFAFFTRNPRGGKAKEIDKSDADALINLMKENKFGKIVAHAPYTMNLCSDKPDIRKFAFEMLYSDIKRMEFLPGNFYNFHPGSHVGQGTDIGIKYICEALNNSLFEGMSTCVLLETMAGKGSEIGGTFEELRRIIDDVNLKKNIGVCLDTCHVSDAGYDITNFDNVLEQFDKIIGIDRLKAIHLNDSMNQCGAHKDRHEKLGKGKIGIEALRKIWQNPVLQDKPFILETPNDDAGYILEIKEVRKNMI